MTPINLRFRNRIIAWWNTSILDGFINSKEVCEDGKVANVLVVTHGAYINCLCDLLVEQGLLANLEGFDLDYGVYNASVTLFEMYKDGFGRLVSYSDIAHLEADYEAEDTNADLESVKPSK